MSMVLDLAPLLYRALGEPIGLVLRTGDPQRARAALYTARRKAQDPLLDDLQIRPWALDGGDLVICKLSATGGIAKLSGAKAPNPGDQV